MYDNRPEMESNQYKAWRFSVFKRDDYTCQLCNLNGKNIVLNAHHIVPWSKNEKLRYVTSNGITLCEKCHQMVNGHENQYEDQFKRVVAQKRIEEINKRGIRLKGKVNKARLDAITKYRPINPNIHRI